MRHLWPFTSSLALAASLASSLADLAFAEVPMRLEPSGPWNLNYSPDNCRLGRPFGKGDDQVLYILDSYGASTYTSLVGARFRSNSLSASASLRWDDHPQARISATSAMIGKPPQPMLLLSPGSGKLANGDESGLIPANTANLSDLEIGFGTKRTILHVGPLEKPLAALKKCTSEMITAWGSDPVAEASKQRAAVAINSPGSWITSNDYPNDSLSHGFSGIVRFRLKIADSGVPSDCVIQTETNPASFGPLTCKLLLQRAKFMPALDSTGKPMSTFYVSAINWIWQSGAKVRYHAK